MSYASELLNKNYLGNVVIYMLGQYFCIRQPDSGLVISPEYHHTVSSLNINPASVDVLRVNTTTESYSFDLTDIGQIVTTLIGKTRTVANTTVQIWIGRSNVGMDFSQYFKLPDTLLQAIQFQSRTYSVTTIQPTVKLNKTFFSLTTKIQGTLLAASTTITVTDVSSFPISGILMIDTEMVSYTGIDTVHNQFTGCTRGYSGTIAADHNDGADVFNVIHIQDNPMNLLLQLLISNGGGGIYDVLADGVGLDPNLIDVATIELLRDTTFLGQTYSFMMYNIGTAIDFIQNEILLPCNLRFITSSASKISVALLNQALFGADVPTIDETSQIEEPTWNFDSTRCVNVIVISWDWDDSTQTYKRRSTFKDNTSIASIGEMPHWDLTFRGIKQSLGGDAIVTAMGTRFLDRFSTPFVEIDLSTQIVNSLINVGDKVLVISNRVPNIDGSLSFAAVLEVIERSIDHASGVVTFKTMYTSYTGQRIGYIAPTDTILSHSSQSVFSITTGHGKDWYKGMKLMLWDSVTYAFTVDAPNPILSISGDTITMTNAWATTIIDGRHQIRFADYDNTGAVEHIYAFVGLPYGGMFSDGTNAYQITV